MFKRIHFKCHLILNLLACYISSFGQGTDDSICYIYKYPVDKGYMYKYKEKIGAIQDPARSITVYASGDFVYAVADGKVKTVFELSHAYYIMVESVDSIFIYGNLQKPSLDYESNIKKGQLIGKISGGIITPYELIFGILLKSNVKDLNYIELYDYLVQNFSLREE